MPVLFIEWILHGITVMAGQPRRGRSCVRGVCVSVCVVDLERPCVMPCLGWYFCMLALLRMMLQGLGLMTGQLSLLYPLLRSEDQAGLLVSLLEGMVSCKQGWELVLLP